jgi:hypothetical protein
VLHLLSCGRWSEVALKAARTIPSAKIYDVIMVRFWSRGTLSPGVVTIMNGKSSHVLNKVIVGVVENQLRDGNPLETKLTLDRLRP